MISLALIVKNEEDVLARCLDSVKDVVDEIVIVDTGSTDSTKEIASKYTDKVYDFKWIDDFAAARNFSFSKCTHDFIFWLDADDYMLPEEAAKIRQLDLSDKDTVLCGYEYSRDQYGNVECVLVRERIVRRSLGHQWQGEIHETMPLLGNVYNSDIKIQHYKKHCTSERNLKILNKIVKKNPNNSRNMYYLGKECKDFGQSIKAIRCLEKFVVMTDAWWEDVANAYLLLAQCYLENGDEKKFKKYIYKTIDMEERRAEPYYELGDFYFSKQQWSKAIHWYQLCLNTERPTELLSTYYPQYYTWMPAIQLCLCYNNLNRARESYEYNELALRHRPTDEALLNNRRILSEALERKQNGEGKKLNLGCGNKRMEGYVNVDLFEEADEQFELDNIPYQDGTIAAINSEHSLEHVSFTRVRKAIEEWYRVLRPGGELLLKIPDLELCCQRYLNPDQPTVNYYPARDWYKYTIFGVQRSQYKENDEAQFHRSGFSKEEIRRLLEEAGFVIDYLENYDGWHTPSIGIRALKPTSNLKVGWIAPENWEAAQTRIRVLNVDRWLRSRGYQSKVMNYPEIINDGYDIAIVGKTFDEHHFKNIKLLKQRGKTVFCDLCEDILEFEWVKKILSICDKVICCSYKLEEKVKRINSNTIVIEDAYE